MNYKIEGIYIICNHCGEKGIADTQEAVNKFMDKHDEKCQGAIIKKENHAH